jgi:hypothetical protein
MLARYLSWLEMLDGYGGYAGYYWLAMLVCCVLKMAMLPGYARYVGWLEMLGILARVAG